MIFVTGLPRSRTYWFSRYLSLCGAPCHHEYLNGLRSRGEFYQSVANGVGNSDHMLHITDYEERFPDSRRLIIHRPLDEVVRSLEAISIRPCMDQLMENLSGIKRATGLHIRYGDINRSLRAIHEYMIPHIPFNRDIARRMIDQRLESPTKVGDPASIEIWRN